MEICLQGEGETGKNKSKTEGRKTGVSKNSLKYLPWNFFLPFLSSFRELLAFAKSENDMGLGNNFFKISKGLEKKFSISTGLPDTYSYTDEETEHLPLLCSHCACYSCRQHCSEFITSSSSLVIPKEIWLTSEMFHFKL